MELPGVVCYSAGIGLNTAVRPFVSFTENTQLLFMLKVNLSHLEENALNLKCELPVAVLD